MLGEVKGQMIAVPWKVEPVIPSGHLLDVLEVEAVRTADREANAVRNDGHAVGDGAEKRRAARIRDVAWVRRRSHIVPEDVGDNLHEGERIPIGVDELLQLRLVRQADTELRDRSGIDFSGVVPKARRLPCPRRPTSARSISPTQPPERWILDNESIEAGSARRATANARHLGHDPYLPQNLHDFIERRIG